MNENTGPSTRLKAMAARAGLSTGDLAAACRSVARCVDASLHFEDPLGLAAVIAHVARTRSQQPQDVVPPLILILRHLAVTPGVELADVLAGEAVPAPPPPYPAIVGNQQLIDVLGCLAGAVDQVAGLLRGLEEAGPVDRNPLHYVLAVLEGAGPVGFPQLVAVLEGKLTTQQVADALGELYRQQHADYTMVDNHLEFTSTARGRWWLGQEGVGCTPLFSDGTTECNDMHRLICGWTAAGMALDVALDKLLFVAAGLVVATDADPDKVVRCLALNVQVVRSCTRATVAVEVEPNATHSPEPAADASVEASPFDAFLHEPDTFMAQANTLMEHLMRWRPGRPTHGTQVLLLALYAATTGMKDRLDYVREAWNALDGQVATLAVPPFGQGEVS